MKAVDFRRLDVLEEAARATCGYCREGDEMMGDITLRGKVYPIVFHRGWPGRGDWSPCFASEIRRLQLCSAYPLPEEAK